MEEVMTDKDIVKALEHCANYKNHTVSCIDCPLCGKCDINSLEQFALDLVKRQQAEIERLRKLHQLAVDEREANVKGFTETLDKIHNKAIKEFAERLKESAHDLDISFGYGTPPYVKVVTVGEIDNLVKERTEEYAKTQES